jgi:hypothetical protein
MPRSEGRVWRVVMSALFVWLVGLSPGSSSGAMVNFEAFGDSFTLTNEVPGLSVAGGTILTAGISLNEFDFPPRSGSNVLGALSGVLLLSFSGDPDQVSAYFTFAEMLHVTAFGAGGAVLADFDSLVASNLGSQSLIEVLAPDIELLQLTTTGFSAFTLDDLVFVSAGTVPEPSSIFLAVVALLLLLLSRLRRVGQ